MLKNVVLIVDDDKKITELLKTYFENENFTAIPAYDGETAFSSLKKNKPDIVILDLMLPGMSGFDLLKKMRKECFDIPVIMLTARGEESDKLVGLEIGADDYIAKPFSPKEVVARARAVLRRSKGPDSAVEKTITIGKIVIDQKKYEVTVEGKAVELTPIEFKILELLCQNPGHVMSRLHIIEKVQGYDFEGYERTVDAHIKNIRKKIEDNPQKPKHLLTVFGVGYKLVVPEKGKQ